MPAPGPGAGAARCATATKQIKARTGGCRPPRSAPLVRQVPADEHRRLDPQGREPGPGRPPRNQPDHIQVGSLYRMSSWSLVSPPARPSACPARRGCGPCIPTISPPGTRRVGARSGTPQAWRVVSPARGRTRRAGAGEVGKLLGAGTSQSEKVVPRTWSGVLDEHRWSRRIHPPRTAPACDRPGRSTRSWGRPRWSWSAPAQAWCRAAGRTTG